MITKSNMVARYKKGEMLAGADAIEVVCALNKMDHRLLKRNRIVRLYSFITLKGSPKLSKTQLHP
jgi:lactate dehydrogenase-like 2-hydroxyacid dehydrogenase